MPLDVCLTLHSYSGKNRRVLARVLSCAVIGLDGELVEVEVDISRGALPNTTIVGLPDAAVQESKERVRSAVKNSGLTWPNGARLTINLAPADIRKEGPAYDLPIAVGVLLASGQIVADVHDAIFLGETALTGDVRPTRGILPMVGVARDRGIKRAFVPAENAPEAALARGIEVFAVDSLASLAAHLIGATPLSPFSASTDGLTPEAPAGLDFADIAGQEHVKRAIEVAAAGGHNLVMRGPPGSGKTLLARATPSILPEMTEDDAMEVTRIYSVAGLLPAGSGMLRQPPFRAPHHTVSNAGLIGGGSVPRPGEITLAHRGVLFLDELLEFDPHVLEMLRQPLEDRMVTISRARTACTFPANFMLLSALNPCPCGYLGDPGRDCACSPQAISRYQRRLSGPLLDRIDLFVDVPRVPYEKLAAERRSESSEAIRTRIDTARTLQHRRFEGGSGATALNAHMSPPEVREFAQSQMREDATAILRTAVERLDLSARSFHRILKVARTIADLGSSEAIEAAHVGEAIQYRQRME